MAEAVNDVVEKFSLRYLEERRESLMIHFTRSFINVVDKKN